MSILGRRKPRRLSTMPRQLLETKLRRQVWWEASALFLLVFLIGLIVWFLAQ